MKCLQFSNPQRKNLRCKIADLPSNYICSVDEGDLVRSLADDYRVDVPVLDRKAWSVDPHDEKRRGRGDLGGSFEYSVNVYPVEFRLRATRQSSVCART